jgi:hypothetical protein
VRHELPDGSPRRGRAQPGCVAIELRDPADRVVVSDDICCAYVKRRWDPDNVSRGNLNITPD